MCLSLAGSRSAIRLYGHSDSKACTTWHKCGERVSWVNEGLSVIELSTPCDPTAQLQQRCVYLLHAGRGFTSWDPKSTGFHERAVGNKVSRVGVRVITD